MKKKFLIIVILILLFSIFLGSCDSKTVKEKYVNYKDNLSKINLNQEDIQSIYEPYINLKNGSTIKIKNQQLFSLDNQILTSTDVFDAINYKEQDFSIDKKVYDELEGLAKRIKKHADVKFKDVLFSTILGTNPTDKSTPSIKKYLYYGISKTHLKIPGEFYIISYYVTIKDSGIIANKNYLSSAKNLTYNVLVNQTEHKIIHLWYEQNNYSNYESTVLFEFKDPKTKYLVELIDSFDLDLELLPLKRNYLSVHKTKLEEIGFNFNKDIIISHAKYNAVNAHYLGQEKSANNTTTSKYKIKNGKYRLYQLGINLDSYYWSGGLNEYTFSCYSIDDLQSKIPLVKSSTKKTVQYNGQTRVFFKKVEFNEINITKEKLIIYKNSEFEMKNGSYTSNESPIELILCLKRIDK